MSAAQLWWQSKSPVLGGAGAQEAAGVHVHGVGWGGPGLARGALTRERTQEGVPAPCKMFPSGDQPGISPATKMAAPATLISSRRALPRAARPACRRRVGHPGGGVKDEGRTGALLSLTPWCPDPGWTGDRVVLMCRAARHHGSPRACLVPLYRSALPHWSLIYRPALVVCR